MNTPLEGENGQDAKNAFSQRSVLLFALVSVAAVIGAWFVFAPSPSHTPPAGMTPARLQMTAAAQEYVKNIQIGNIAMSRAENFLHQEVTVVNGEVYNAGNQPVSALRVTAQFTDDLSQVVLRETRDIIGVSDRAITPGERRAFEISFEHVPASWNMQQPAMRVDYLALAASK
jgi:hypothetical protein